MLSGKDIFARMVAVLGKVAQRERGAAPKPPRRPPGARTTAQQATDEPAGRLLLLLRALYGNRRR